VFAIFYEAVRDFFGQAKHLGRPVPVVFASPDRAHAELARVIKRRSQNKKKAKGASDLAPPAATVQAIEDKPALVPFMSLWMPPVPEYDPTRFNPGRFVVSKDKASGTAVVMRFPRPIKNTVQVDLWCGSKAGHKIAMALAPQIDLRFFAESVHLPVDWTLDKWYRPPFDVLSHARVLGQTRIRLIAKGWTDNTDLETEDGPKEARMTWSGELEGYIPYRPVEARLVRTVRFELYDSTQEPPALLVADDAGSED
jgi:hypothetical protein